MSLFTSIVAIVALIVDFRWFPLIILLSFKIKFSNKLSVASFCVSFNLSDSKYVVKCLVSSFSDILSDRFTVPFFKCF